jgi:hypothetical protein
LFLLPVSRRHYAIVKGTGYHELELLAGKPVTYYTSIHFPSSALGIESETAYLEYAKSCGLLEKITATTNLFLAFRGRRTTPKFKFPVNNKIIEVNRAQIEVYGVFESQSLEQILLIEAKVGIPNSFVSSNFIILIGPGGIRSQ